MSPGHRRFFALALIMALTAAAFLLIDAASFADSVEPADEGDFGAAEARKASRMPEQWITADHSQHQILAEGNFTSGPEVTAACLTCHNQAALQIHETIHWTWLCPADPERELGKAGLTLNNFCISVPSNEPRCTSCHVGYGWSDDGFDFDDPTRVDCLVCHAQTNEETGPYLKFPAGSGNPVAEEKVFPGNGRTYFPPNWNAVAMSVGRPTRRNCGQCHFNGGGGNGVKHGDLDQSLLTPSRDLDVHMDAEGPDFDCVRCHTTESHRIAGRCYKQPAATDRRSLIDSDLITRITCESCHTDAPHEPGHKANDHTDIVACQSCHIPTFARVMPTKMFWDWSSAGRMRDGAPYKVMGDLDRPTYDTKKGDFIWEMDVVPEYFWFDGTLEYTLLTDEIDPSDVVRLNVPVGERGDPDSRIYPFKVHLGVTPYDAGNNRMAVPHLFGKDENAYWKSFDWAKAIQAGTDYIRNSYPEVMEFSGEVGFVETEYHFQITHMVAPKENSLECAACHSDESRLSELTGFYMPGRDANSLLDTIGWIAVFGSLVGVGGHGLLRMFSSKNNEEASS